MLDRIIALDVTFFTWINGLHHPAADLFFLIVTQLGNGWVAGPVLAAAVFFKVPRPVWLRVFIFGIVAMTLCGVINSQVKREVRRMRPVAYWKHRIADSSACTSSVDRYVVHQVGPDYSSRSFPSGHTNTAFSAAAFLVLLFGRRFLLAFLAAFLVGYSRIYLGVHFPLDVFCGALLGCGCMVLFWKICRHVPFVKMRAVT